MQLQADFEKDCTRVSNLLKEIDIIDIVSFGSSITPEYLISLIANADTGGKKFGFVGTSLPGNGWHAGLNNVALAGKVEWVVGGFFATVRQIGVGIAGNRLSAVNFPQGVLAKLLTLPQRQLETRIGHGTFLDPDNKAGVFNIHRKELGFLGDLVSRVAPGTLRYCLPQSQAVLVRAVGQTIDGAIVPETTPIDLDIAKIVDAARVNGTRILVQMPPGPLLPKQPNAIPLVEGDELFTAPRELHGTCFFPNRYLEDQSAVHGRRGALVDSLVEKVQPRIKQREKLIVGIGYPVAIAQALGKSASQEINVESGNIDGIPLDGSGFGFNIAPKNRISQLEMFERIWGGDLDHALLGLGEIDSLGSINIAKLGPHFNGVGGFVDISQSVEKITFCSPKKPISDMNVDWISFVSRSDQDVEWITAT